MKFTRFFVVFIFAIACITARAQYSVYSDGDKQGVKQNDKIIIKAKYERVVIGDTAVFALLKNGTWQYVTAGGKEIYSLKESDFLPYKNGYGFVIDHKTFNCYTINSKGEVLSSYYERTEPSRYHKLLVFDAAVYDCYGNVICRGYERIERLSNTLLFIKKAGGESSGMLLNTTGQVLHEGSIPEAVTQQLWYVKGTGGKPGFLMNASGTAILKNILTFNVHDKDLAKVTTASGTGIYNFKSQNWLIKPDGIAGIEFVNGYFWASAADSSFSLIADVQGKQKRIDGIKIDRAGTERILVATNNEVALYSFSGERFGDSYSSVYSDVSCNRLAVTKGTSFAYIDAETGRLCSNFYPLYYRVGQRGFSETGKTIIKGMTIVVASPLLPLVSRKLDKYSLRPYIEPLNPPPLYNNGLALIAVAEPGSEQKRNDSLFLSSSVFLDYVFIDTTGKEVSPRYHEALPFANDWTWVKKNERYQRIDRKFKPLFEKESFNDIQAVWNGAYFFVEKEVFFTGLMNSKGEWIAKPIYTFIMDEGDQLVGIKDGNRTVLVKK